MDTVYVSQGGHAMHKDPGCRAFNQAHDLWRYDPREWVPGMPQIMLDNGHPLRELTVGDAFSQGWRPCAVCYPTLRGVAHRGASKDGFGHQPEPNQHHGSVCSRCRLIVTHYDEAYEPSRWVKPVPWPCGTAVILGLPPRDGEAS